MYRYLVFGGFFNDRGVGMDDFIRGCNSLEQVSEIFGDYYRGNVLDTYTGAILDPFTRQQMGTVDIGLYQSNDGDK